LAKSQMVSTAENLKDERFGSGPSQPEMQTFSSVNASNMVDLFSGDFSYNIPLMDVGGYPINLSYRSGITMDQEASWVGLGWNVNPGTINRNLRGLPDDFNGTNDSIKKVTSIKENKTIGFTVGGDMEIAGVPQSKGSDSAGGLSLGVGRSLGFFVNNYKGWGIETALNVSINSGRAAKGALSGGLSFTNNSQEGFSVDPSLSLNLAKKTANDVSTGVGFTVGSPYNSRGGLKGLQLSVGVNQSHMDAKNQRFSANSGFSSVISFADPTHTPSINLPFMSRQFSFTAKVGLENVDIHPNLSVSGYVSRQKIDPADTLLALPSYGYLYYQDGVKNSSALLDFNREKELPYSDKPGYPHIAVPFYTYDAFSITGEGTGGMFRAYRGDIGFVYDHLIKTKDESDKASIDFGVPGLVHWGTDINITRAFTQNGPWVSENNIKKAIAFRENSKDTEAVYFRNPGEKTVNSKSYYDAIGNDDLVAVQLYQPSSSSSTIQATSYLTRYQNKQPVGKIKMARDSSFKREREKRGQVISFLTAKEADVAALSKYIENYPVNDFDLSACYVDSSVIAEATGSGLPGDYYNTKNWSGLPIRRLDSVINFLYGHNPTGKTFGIPTLNDDRISIRWDGRIKAPVSGLYSFYTSSDDGVMLWINDSLLINNSYDHKYMHDSCHVNLIGGEMYKFRIEYYQNKGHADMQLEWAFNGKSRNFITTGFMYPPAKDSFVFGRLIKEKRINSFRKENHISEITVLNDDGRRYVYGLPIYNLRQKEATFAVAKDRGNEVTGFAGYDDGIDNTTRNSNGNDWYFNSEETPAYAHSFLLTGIVSPDYVDLTGNGISDDDLGDGIKFNYSKVCGFRNEFSWRAPFNDSVTFNEGLRTDFRDDKGSYVFGKKELWYLHSIVSKTMIATFTLEDRADQLGIDESGHKYQNGAKRLKEINLYSKADFLKDAIHARPIKTVHFEYTYELCRGINHPNNDSGKLTLKKVWFSYNGNNKGKKNPYIFNYNSKNPCYKSNAYDRWGNYKDPGDNPGWSTSNRITNAEYPYSLQDSVKAANNAAAWTLDSIYLPSGGALKVKYESDDYAYVQNRRAMQLFKICGLGKDSLMSTVSNRIHDKVSNDENLFVYVSIPDPVSDKKDVFQKYLYDISKLYFRLYVKMPDDQYGKGYEYVTCYADLDDGRYGRINDHVIWVKLSGISLKGDEGGSKSPLGKAATQFLRLNLPSKAYPGSEVGEDVNLESAIKVLVAMKDNIATSFSSFDRVARDRGWASQIDTSRSYMRLDNPYLKKYGGGHRVKSITIYDHWDKMTQGRAETGATYGQEYTYTEEQVLGHDTIQISSGVASWEPSLGGDENPFHLPIEYIEKVSPMSPVTLGYTEEPLGESLFPAPSVGYSRVQVRTIHHINKRSANGFEETRFYTAKDFPVFTDHTLLDQDTKKRYKPGLANFLRINAQHYLTISQGFKVELNDMNGKLRSQATYAETDLEHPITYTENIYRVTNPYADAKKLSNSVMAINSNGLVDTAAVVGQDVELMVDMREQLSITNGYNVSLNTDMFTVPAVPPYFILPSFLNLAQSERDLFRSVAILKVIDRHGILDSVIHIDKGSKVSTKDILYDGETGNAILNRTQNEFNDPIYNLTYPAHWAYQGVGPAYKNIGSVFKGVTIREGRISSGLSTSDQKVFVSGDEVLVAGKQSIISSALCFVPRASFPNYVKLWVIDTSEVVGGAKTIFFIDKDGKPYTGFDITLKIIRSGRRNIASGIGTVTSLNNPIAWNSTTNNYQLMIDSSSKVVSAASSVWREFWPVSDRKKKRYDITCTTYLPQDCTGSSSCVCNCLKNLFAYLVASHRLFVREADSIKVSSIVQDASDAGYDITTDACELIQKNSDKFFHSLTNDSIAGIYRARIGDCTVSWVPSEAVNFYSLVPLACDTASRAVFYDPTSHSRIDTLNTTLYPDRSMTLYHSDPDAVPYIFESFPFPVDSVDKETGKIITGIYETSALPDIGGGEIVTQIHSFLKFARIDQLPPVSNILSATLNLYGTPDGISSPTIIASHSGYPPGYDGTNPFEIGVPNFDWDYDTSKETLLGGVNSPSTDYVMPFYFGDLSIDALPFITKWKSDGNRGLRFSPISYYTWNFLFSSFASERYKAPNYTPTIDVTYTAPKDTIFATLDVEYCQSCDTIIDNSCKGVVTDTLFNPYVTGLLGNWRINKNYSYYSRRFESDPLSKTNTRTDGTIAAFKPFWKFANDTLRMTPDSTRWVWNSEMTLFNQKGLEIENKDPLGRFNSGLYGYNLTLPTAVIQNSRYRESAFEGFEDYGFVTQVCDTSCSSSRHFDFGMYRSKIDTSERHTGKFSLKLLPGEEVGLTASTSTELKDSSLTNLVFTLGTNSCAGGPVLKDVKIPGSDLLQEFSPLQGKRMVLSAWVKENQACQCRSYTKNRITIAFTGDSVTSIQFAPSGNIIEGWQRYEAVFEIPSSASGMIVNLESTDTATVYFDDIRIHPYNANMKSFVFHPVNLRLMAELDENNYATFYEYDDDGTLIRVKKETEKGIKTIKESRSALLKN
jgi:hypothetical protein